ncbi:MAG: hypothetical protein A4E55_01733 [Pelotomaculum sp. PtaU1.Bin035]|nr:MAG: hypothetical protein A4E55_01733 [Pelotomaculum sp. PtaU1.Bin035]
MDYNLISNQIIFEVDEIVETLEDFIGEYILIEHYYEDQLIEAQIIYVEDIEVDYEPGEASRFFKQKYIKDDTEDQEFLSLLKNNFVTSLYINGSLLEIEIEGGRMAGLVGSRGELILRTGQDSYVFSALFNLKISPGDVAVLLNAVIGTLKNIHDEIANNKIENESFAMISGVCLMAIAKINELPLNEYELNLSHDEMLLLGLALNIASENTDKETQKVTRSVMEQIKSYFPEIEHISPESFEPPPNMGQLLDFKRPEKPPGK